MPTPTHDGYIRLKDIPHAATLGPGAKLVLIHHSMVELAMAQTYMIIHGDNAAEVYVQRGGLIRFDDDGEPVIPVSAADTKPLMM